MPRYVSSQHNRIYAAKEGDYGIISLPSPASMLPAVELNVIDTALRPIREDKTGTRTALCVTGPFRHSVRYQLTTYLTRSASETQFPNATLLEAALGQATTIQPPPLQSVAGSLLTFAAPHFFTKGAALATSGEIRFVQEVVSSTAVRLNAPFASSGSTSLVLVPTVSFFPAGALPSFSLFDYWKPDTAVQRILRGAGVDLFRFTLNGDLHKIRVEGPAAAIVDSATFQPGDGGLEAFPQEPTPPSSPCTPVPGHLGQVWLGATPSRLFTLIGADFRLDNQLDTRNLEFGSLTPRALVPGRRKVSLDFELYCEDHELMLDLFRTARREQSLSIFFQLGQRAGELLGLYIPALHLDAPLFDESQPRLVWKFRNGQATGEADDEVFLAMA